jgi:dihydroxyacid dehydratase/phosphogluconate dehydratase
VFTSEADAIRAIKGLTDHPVRPDDVLVLIGAGPSGTGMEETYQLTAALKHLPWGRTVPIVTDARFSGVSTGACIGHVGPEALAGGPIGKVRDGDVVEIVIDRQSLTGTVDVVEADGLVLTREQGTDLLRSRSSHPDLRPHALVPADTRLWAALQQVGGGTWGGCVYDVDRIVKTLEAGTRALSEAPPGMSPPARDLDGRP